MNVQDVIGGTHCDAEAVWNYMLAPYTSVEQAFQQSNNPFLLVWLLKQVRVEIDGTEAVRFCGECILTVKIGAVPSLVSSATLAQSSSEEQFRAALNAVVAGADADRLRDVRPSWRSLSVQSTNAEHAIYFATCARVEPLESIENILTCLRDEYADRHGITIPIDVLEPSENWMLLPELQPLFTDLANRIRERFSI